MGTRDPGICRRGRDRPATARNDPAESLNSNLSSPWLKEAMDIAKVDLAYPDQLTHALTGFGWSVWSDRLYKVQGIHGYHRVLTGNQEPLGLTMGHMCHVY